MSHRLSPPTPAIRPFWRRIKGHAALALLLSAIPGHADTNALPGFSLSDAQILSRDATSYRVEAKDTIRPDNLELAIAQLCRRPASARALFKTDGRHPARITYLVRCTG